jgi:putative N6-adenine-specific DNA methylase
MPESLDLFAITAPGLEPLCAAELGELGIAPAPTVVAGGVTWSGDLRSLYRANLECRLASRVVARVGQFRARSFVELERHVQRLPWARFLGRGRTVRLRVTCRKSKLYHERAVAERFLNVLQALFDVRGEIAPGDDEDGPDTGDAQLLIVRFMRDECTVSADASGALLHQRGYRQALAKAPLRETMAAAILDASGWQPELPLVDPFCGSGTIVIEAALRARRIAPGLSDASRDPRHFAFEAWPGADARLWTKVVTTARERILDRAPAAIAGYDHIGGAIRAARSNADRAGVSGDVEFRVQPVAELARSEPTGWIVTNPPYGVRVGERREVGALYATLGRSMRERLDGWKLAMLAAAPPLAARTGLPLRDALATRNGGIAVNLLVTEDASKTAAGA